jgi:hypothetical protein
MSERAVASERWDGDCAVSLRRSIPSIQGGEHCRLCRTVAATRVPPRNRRNAPEVAALTNPITIAPDHEDPA